MRSNTMPAEPSRPLRDRRGKHSPALWCLTRDLFRQCGCLRSGSAARYPVLLFLANRALDIVLLSMSLALVLGGMDRRRFTRPSAAKATEPVARRVTRMDVLGLRSVQCLCASGGPPKPKSDVRDGDGGGRASLRTAMKDHTLLRPVDDVSVFRCAFHSCPFRGSLRGIRKTATHPWNVASVPRSRRPSCGPKNGSYTPLRNCWRSDLQRGHWDVSGPLCQDVASVPQHDPGMRYSVARQEMQSMQVQVRGWPVRAAFLEPPGKEILDRCLLSSGSSTTSSDIAPSRFPRRQPGGGGPT